HGGLSTGARTPEGKARVLAALSEGRRSWRRGRSRRQEDRECLLYSRRLAACSGAHYIGRQLAALGHNVRLMPAQYVQPFLKGHKNDYRDAEAIAEAVQQPTMHFVAIKTPEQMDLLALHRVRSRLVGQRTGVTNQIAPSCWSVALPFGKACASAR